MKKEITIAVVCLILGACIALTSVSFWKMHKISAQTNQNSATLTQIINFLNQQVEFSKK